MLLDFNSLVKKYDLKIRGVIHIGAHYGEEHKLYKENNINNIIYFEPLKNNFDTLRNNIKDDVIFYNYALGSEEKEIEMFVETANNGQSSSILEPHLHKQQYPHIVFNNKEMVKMKRLDDFQIEDYNFINIDVQGYELEVFKGAKKTLENVDYIISEINRAELYKNCASVNQLIEFLKPYGFDLIEESWDGYTWGDGLFIKK